MDMLQLWGISVSAIVGLLVYVFKNHISVQQHQEEEISSLRKLVNRTREEIAREYVTKAEVHADINRVLDRIEALDAKLDRLFEGRK